MLRTEFLPKGNPLAYVTIGKVHKSLRPCRKVSINMKFNNGSLIYTRIINKNLSETGNFN